jgi:hypothetical protein
MKRQILQVFRKITDSPSVNITVGVIFFLTGLIEIWNDIEDITIGAHHGAVLFGLFHIIKYVPDLIEGLEYVQKSQ